MKEIKRIFFGGQTWDGKESETVVDPILIIDKLRNGARGLPDGFDDPRIDNVCHVLKDILDLAQKNGAISLIQIEEIVADSTEHPDFWDEDRVW